MIISEVIDRQSRSRNLIIFNLPESDDISSTESDKLSVKSILDSISPNLVTTVLSRLGRKSTKPRPLKVMLLDSFDIFTVLKNKHTLRTSSTYASIRISPDRTNMQRSQLRDVVSKLEQRKAAGEPNLLLKFVKGIPTISKNL